MRTLTPRAAEVLDCCVMHRLLEAEQVQALLYPDHTTLRKTQQVLAELVDRGLLGRVRSGRQNRHRHFPTDRGYKAAGVAADRSHRMTAELAVANNAKHTIGLNWTAISYVAAALQRGHHCDYLSWSPEEIHRFGRRHLIADAVLSYTDDEGTLWRFIEYDRGTYSPERLWHKIRSYVDYQASGEWVALYPAGFPKLNVVIDHRIPIQGPARIRQVASFCAGSPAVGLVSLCLYDDLRARGPWAPIWTVPGADRPVDLLGRPVLHAASA